MCVLSDFDGCRRLKQETQFFPSSSKPVEYLRPQTLWRSATSILFRQYIFLLIKINKRNALNMTNSSTPTTPPSSKYWHYRNVFYKNNNMELGHRTLLSITVCLTAKSLLPDLLRRLRLFVFLLPFLLCLEAREERQQSINRRCGTYMARMIWYKW